MQLKKKFHNGDWVLFESGHKADIYFDQRLKTYSWHDKSSVEFKATFNKIFAMLPRGSNTEFLRTWADLFEFCESQKVQPQSQLSYFLTWNVIFALAGSVLIIAIQSILRQFISTTATMVITSFGLPFLLLLFRAERGNRKQVKKYEHRNHKSYIYAILHQIFFAAGLVLLMAYEGMSSTITAMESGPILACLMLFLAYLLIMYISEWLFGKHIQHNKSWAFLHTAKNP